MLVQVAYLRVNHHPHMAIGTSLGADGDDVTGDELIEFVLFHVI